MAADRITPGDGGDPGDLRRAELIAFPLVLLLSFWVFRGVVAAFLPPLVGAGAIALTFLGLRIAVEVHSLSVFALNLVTGLGLGLAIDYSLFIVSRWREEAARHGHGPEALAATMRSAGRTVFFSALTVAALDGLPARLPAAVPLLDGAWGCARRALGRARRPRAAARLPLLARAQDRLAGAAPPATAAVGRSLGTTRCVGDETARSCRRALGIGAHRARPARARRPLRRRRRDHAAVVGELAAGRRGARPRRRPRALRADHRGHRQPRPRRRALARLAVGAGVAGVVPARQIAPDLWRLDLLPSEKGLAEPTQQLVRTVRAELPSSRVTGQTAGFIDQQASLAAHLPWALAILVVTTCTLIFLFTGSVVLPVKSLLMNVLTLGASFGILVVVFEWGQGLAGLESTQPILLCATAFGLSTDYAIFLFTRIKEARDRGLENRAAVADGMERTGRVVTAAALLFCVAIGTFATSGISFIQELGVGTAVAVALDATIIRALLVPEPDGLARSVELVGAGPLRRLHARLGLVD